MKHFNALNIIFFFSVLLIILIALGAVPRQAAFLILSAYLIFVLLKPVEESMLLFVRSIPFFIALPITANFDNFNMWRLVVIAIFIKWIVASKLTFPAITPNISRIKELFAKHRITMLAIILLVLALLSVLTAQDLTVGIKRIIYFLNLALIGIIIGNLVGKNNGLIVPIAKNIVLGGITVLALGYLQLLSVFFIQIDVWHYWWGKQISLNLYGQNWSDIVIQGNTWFSYTAGSLKLRMFSIMPDSHSFPLYLLMVMPAAMLTVFWQFREKIINLWQKSWIEQIKEKISILKTEPRALDWLIFFILAFFALILSGTRGIWVSVAFPIIFAAIFIVKYPKWRNWAYSICKVLALFLILLPVASLFWTIPQFQLGKTTEQTGGKAFIERIQSSFDTEETSNVGRIFIWKETMKSLSKNPILGVGIGNFPVVLEQDIKLAKAGSSAHNLYLNVVAEMGFIALGAFLFLLFEILKNAWRIFERFNEPHLRIFGLASVVFLLWVFGYSLTDAALFDERAFLIFMALAGLIIGLSKGKNNGYFNSPHS